MTAIDPDIEPMRLVIQASREAVAAGISRLVFAATQADIGAALGAPLLPITAAEVYAGSAPAVQGRGGVLADEAHAVLRSA